MYFNKIVGVVVAAGQDILRAKLKILVELFTITGKEFFFVEFLCGSGVGGIYNFYLGFFSGAPTNIFAEHMDALLGVLICFTVKTGDEKSLRKPA